MSPCHCSTSRPFVITGPAEIIGELLCGPAQHNEHMRGYRWFLYTLDANRRRSERDAILMAEVRKMASARRERLEMLQREIRELETVETPTRLSSQQQADLALAEWQSHRRARA